MSRKHVTVFLATAALATVVATSPQKIAAADVSGSAPTLAQPEPDLATWLPDKNLQTNLQQLLGPDVPLTQANLAKLTTANLTYSDVTNLKGLEFAKNLQQLDLTGNAISDLTPLQHLTQLTDLSLRLNKADQLPDLAKLGQVPIQQLNLVGDAYGTAPQQLAGLSQLTQLQSLKLVNSKLTTLPPLAPTAPLTTLDLSGNKLTDVTGLANFPLLTTLSLGSNQIADWRPVANLNHLTSLTTGNNPQTNISVLQRLTQLKKLNLSQLGMTNQDLKLVTNMTSLQDLAIDFNGTISDLSPLAGLKQLTDLDFSKDAVSDLSPLAGLTQLANLSLSNNQVTDLSPLANLTQLGNLTILRNQVRDLSPLKLLNKLTYLNAKFQFVTMPTLTIPSDAAQFNTRLSAKAIDGTVIPLTYQSGLNAIVNLDQINYSGLTDDGQTSFSWDNAAGANKLSSRFSGSLIQPIKLVQTVVTPTPTPDVVPEPVTLSVMKGDNQNLTSVASNYILPTATLTRHADGSGSLTFTANVPANYGKDSIAFTQATQVSADLIGSAYILTYTLPLSAAELAQPAILEDMQVAIDLPGFDYHHAYQVYFKLSQDPNAVPASPAPIFEIPQTTPDLQLKPDQVFDQAATPLLAHNQPSALQPLLPVLSAQPQAIKSPMAQPVTTTKQPLSPVAAATVPTAPKSTPAPATPAKKAPVSHATKPQKVATTHPNPAPKKITKHHGAQIAIFTVSLLSVLGLYSFRVLRK